MTNGDCIIGGGRYVGNSSVSSFFNGNIQDFRIYKGVAKYKGGFDVPKPYTPVGIAAWRAVPDTTANNFATWNAVDIDGTLSDGNLKASTGTSGSRTVGSTFSFSSGKWYSEFYVISNAESNLAIGLVNSKTSAEDPNLRIYNYTDSVVYFQFNGNKYIDGVSSSYGATFTNGDIVGISFDLDNNEITFYKNGSSQGTITSKSFIGHYQIMLGSGSSAGAQVVSANFGQNPTFSGNTTAGTYTDSNGKGLFKYEPPSGFLALCEDNLPTPAIKNPGEYFKTVLYTGDGNDGRSITGIGFTPDLVWIKARNATEWNNLYDSVRGANKGLYTNSTYQEENLTETFESFDSNGFTVSYNSAYSSVFTNKSGSTYAAWCWRAGAGTTSTNTDGSINSVVSVNQDAGFSIVSYTGTSSSITVGHELGKTPNMILFKNRDQADKWAVYHSSIGATKFLSLNETTAATTASSYFADTEPTSSVFTVNQTGPVNQTGEKYIAYCWAEIEGFSKFGSYVGNGNADGPFVYCGFKPAWVMYKRTDTTGDWAILDSSRQSINPLDLRLFANNANVDTTGVTSFDFLSNGFKIRDSAGSINASGATYIFAAFAESPFSTANAK
jgi:hypothetical protein